MVLGGFEGDERKKLLSSQLRDQKRVRIESSRLALAICLQDSKGCN